VGNCIWSLFVVVGPASVVTDPMANRCGHLRIPQSITWIYPTDC